MPDWYVEVATQMASPYLDTLAAWLAVCAVAGVIVGIISLIFGDRT